MGKLVVLDFSKAPKDPAHPRTLFIVPGMATPALAFFELVDDVVGKSFDRALIIDHLGQGFSSRLTLDPERFHAIDYDVFLEDIDFTIGKSGLVLEKENLYLLGHSMGGALVAMYLQNFSHPQVRAALMSAPMLKIRVPSLGSWTEPVLGSLSGMLCLWRWSCEHYATEFFGKPHGWREDPNRQRVTHSTTRFTVPKYFFDTYPEAEVRGPTVGWLDASLRATARIRDSKSSIDIPLLVVNAGDDPLVDPSEGERFCAKQKSCKNMVMVGAKHSIFMETDSYRTPFLEHLNGLVIER